MFRFPPSDVFRQFFFINTARLHLFSFVLLSASGFSWFFSFLFNVHKQETLCARLSLLPRLSFAIAAATQ
jgi:hypothetical protein